MANPAVSTDQIRTLREKTGAGVMECKKALQEAAGSLEKAARILRARGSAIAQEKAGRVAQQGVIAGYVHAGKIGVLVELNCETDFVARTDQFKALAHEICLQIASMDPLYLSRDEVPAQDVQLMKEKVLLDQPFVKDPTKTVEDLIHEAVSSMRENIRIRRFARFALGEALKASPPTA